MILLDKETIESYWQRFAAGVELALGHSLEGDELLDGYSVGSAHNAFEDGRTAWWYVCRVLENPIYKAGIRTQGNKVN